ncbi:MAG: (2E,6E)-farnesyl diphosphate synthase [Gammaproteobacteria bacterium]|nr:(2E,6E)-farnesyl diphosphate synthase [Gammaproteobacteria bacterium]
MTNDFNKTLAHYRDRVELTLKNTIVSAAISSKPLSDAMLYATLNGGKRLRPILVYATGLCLGQTPEALDAIAAAVECIHCYSLIHDDLPAMDDDKLRRGKPTCHIAFGEACAILAGDALQTLAFELLSTPSTITPQNQLKIIRLLTQHSGALGMVGGQSLDLLAEGKAINFDDLEHIHRLKTGALIKSSVMMGAIAAECDDLHLLSTLEEFANRIGLAFQLQDDLLDITGNTKNLGKNTGQDIKMQKATYAILLGIEETQTKIKILMDEAISLLRSLHMDISFLEALCVYLIKRDN